MRYANKITGIYNIYAIIGGFHLSGEIYEDVIDPTLDELVKLDARFIVHVTAEDGRLQTRSFSWYRMVLFKAVSGQSSSCSELKENDRLLAKTLELAVIEISKDVCVQQPENVLTKNLQIID